MKAPELFMQAGRALYGDNWQQATAQLLGWPVDDRGQNRTVQRIKAAAIAGKPYRIAPGVLDELAKALDQRGAECARAATALRDAIERADTT